MSVSIPKPVRKLSGRLIGSASGWLLLEVPNALVRGLFAALDVPGAELPPGYGGGPLRAHISVMRKAEVDSLGGVGKISEIGKRYRYQLGELKEVKPGGWEEMDRAWLVEVSSPDLETLRKSYGLPPEPVVDGEVYKFHITVAVRRKGILRKNDLSKTAEHPRLQFRNRSSPAVNKPFFPTPTPPTYSGYYDTPSQHNTVTSPFNQLPVANWRSNNAAAGYDQDAEFVRRNKWYNNPFTTAGKMWDKTLGIPWNAVVASGSGEEYGRELDATFTPGSSQSLMPETEEEAATRSFARRSMATGLAAATGGAALAALPATALPAVVGAGTAPTLSGIGGAYAAVELAEEIPDIGDHLTQSYQDFKDHRDAKKAKPLKPRHGKLLFPQAETNLQPDLSQHTHSMPRYPMPMNFMPSYGLYTGSNTQQSYSSPVSQMMPRAPVKRPIKTSTPNTSMTNNATVNSGAAVSKVPRFNPSPAVNQLGVHGNSRWLSSRLQKLRTAGADINRAQPQSPVSNS